MSSNKSEPVNQISLLFAITLYCCNNSLLVVVSALTIPIVKTTYLYDVTSCK